MKKYKTLKNICWITTVIFTFIFIVNIIKLAGITTPYGSPVFSFPAILGVFIANSIIPGILWGFYKFLVYRESK